MSVNQTFIHLCDSYFKTVVLFDDVVASVFLTLNQIPEHNTPRLCCHVLFLLSKNIFKVVYYSFDNL